MRRAGRALALVALLLPLRVNAGDVNRDLLEAAKRGDTPAIAALLAAGADVDAKDTDGRTALMFAARLGRSDAIAALLAAGADSEAKDEKGLTALHIAASTGHTAAVEALLAGGADVNAKTKIGTTALLAAAVSGYIDTVEALLAGGADVNAKAQEGTTALMAAASTGRTDIVQALLVGGADINGQDANKRTALLFAAGKGQSATVRALLAAGADVNAKDRWGKTALMEVAFWGRTTAVEALLAAGADVNARDEKGGTALMLVAREGHTAIVRALLAAGADIEATDGNGRSALLFAAWNGHDDVVRALLAAGADVHARDLKGSTALMMAAVPGHTATVRILLAAGADVHAKSKTGSTALLAAAFWGRTETVAALLAAGADVDAEDNEGATALQLAKKEGHTDVVQLLEKAGASETLSADIPGSERQPERSEAGLPAGEKAGKRGLGPGSTRQPVLFQEVTNHAGIQFQHINGATRQKYMPETMGSGGMFFDYDNDGWLDIFLVDGGSLVDQELAGRARSVLYRNNGDGTFGDVTAAAGLRNPHYGMGACAADYDNDGWVDLYLTNVGPNILYRNNGDGSFTEVTSAAGVGSRLWSTSCAFGDIENDGDLDLYITNYVDFALDNNKYCGDQIQRVRAYCHPNVYNGVPDVLYRNNGDGTFSDITREAGIYSTAGKGLGVVFGDYNNDGWVDIYVANDSVPNFLYRNQGNGSFEEVGMWGGVAVNGEGRPEAGMGTDMGDYDNDGWLDIFVTNLDMETNTLYSNTGQELFGDVASESGQGEPSLPFVGFGTAFFDYDNDGDLDVIVANGHILDNASYFRDNSTYAQPNLLFRNQGPGRFQEVGAASGPGFALVKVSRGLAVGDIDNDGDLDVLITNNGQAADLLRNDGGNRMNALLVRALGTKSNRDGVGARLRLTVGSTTQLREVKAGSSYLGQNDLRVHFGLGAAERIERLEVRWPSGTVDVEENLAANQIVTLVEGKGIVRREPFRPAKDKGAPPIRQAQGKQRR